MKDVDRAKVKRRWKIYLGGDIGFNERTLFLLSLEDGGGVTRKIFDFIERGIAGGCGEGLSRSKTVRRGCCRHCVCGWDEGMKILN